MSAEGKMPEPIRAFGEWAKDLGYDTAYTYDTERSRWVFFAMPTNESWLVWQEAARQAMERCAAMCDAKYQVRAAQNLPREASAARSLRDDIRALITQSEKRHG